MLSGENYLKKTSLVKISELLRIADSITTVEKDQYIFREGQVAEEVYIILSGKVLISKLNNDGIELSLRICTQNEICGELILFAENPTYLFNAKVTKDAQVAKIKKELMEKMLLSDPKITEEYLIWFNQHLRKTMTKFRDLILCGKKGSLLSILVRFSNSFGEVQADGSILINHTITNSELASFCASSRETVNIMLNELKNRGLIRMDGRKIIINNLEELKKENGCENCSTAYCSIE